MSTLIRVSAAAIESVPLAHPTTQASPGEPLQSPRYALDVPDVMETEDLQLRRRMMPLGHRRPASIRRGCEDHAPAFRGERIDVAG
jgi:hypothetical protein